MLSRQFGTGVCDAGCDDGLEDPAMAFSGVRHDAATGSRPMPDGRSSEPTGIRARRARPCGRRSDQAPLGSAKSAALSRSRRSAPAAKWVAGIEAAAYRGGCPSLQDSPERAIRHVHRYRHHRLALAGIRGSSAHRGRVQRDHRVLAVLEGARRRLPGAARDETRRDVQIDTSRPITAPGGLARERVNFTPMEVLLPVILKSFPRRQRRRLLIGLALSFLAGPVLAQIVLLIVIGPG